MARVRAKTRVLVVDLDEEIRGAVHTLLSTVVDCYAVAEAASPDDALAYLATQPKGMVVICSNAYADHRLCTPFFAAVAADERLAKRHQYLLLSSDPAHLPDPLRLALLRLSVPVVPKPFDIDVLLTTVGGAAARLTSTRPALLPRWRPWQWGRRGA
jgi:CheY-like chemotaxis protein